MRQYYDVVLIRYDEEKDFGSFSTWGREWAESEEEAIKRVTNAYAKYRDDVVEVFYVGLTKICECCNQVIEIEEEDYDTPENWEKFRKGRK